MGHLEVQDYLQTKSLEDLKEEFGIKFKLAGHEKKCSLTYNQIDSPTGVRLVEECRGLILRKETKEKIDPKTPFGPSKVLACPFFRFYNLGQNEAASIDWGSVQIQEKLDGTLCIVYYDDVSSQFCVATRSVPEADQEMEGFNLTFRQLFEMAYDKYKPKDVSFSGQYGLHKNLTYMFELMSPFNKVVIEHETTKISLIGVRHNETLKELDPSGQFTFDVPKKYQFSNIEEVVSFVNEQDPKDLKMEGVVLCDKDFNRIKIKSTDYVLSSKMKDKLSSSYVNCLSLVLQEKLDDCVGKISSEILTILFDMNDKVRVLISKHEKAYEEICRLSLDENREIDMKKFAREANTSSLQILPWLLFPVARKKHESVEDLIKSNAENKSFLTKILKEMGYKQ